MTPTSLTYGAKFRERGASMLHAELPLAPISIEDIQVGMSYHVIYRTYSQIVWSRAPSMNPLHMGTVDPAIIGRTRGAVAAS